MPKHSMSARQSKCLCQALRLGHTALPAARRLASTEVRKASPSLSPNAAIDRIIPGISSQDIDAALNVFETEAAPESQSTKRAAPSKQTREEFLSQRFDPQKRFDPFNNPYKYLDSGYGTTLRFAPRTSEPKSAAKPVPDITEPVADITETVADITEPVVPATAMTQTKAQLRTAAFKKRKLSAHDSTQVGRVVSAGRMAKTVRVHKATVTWEPYLRKYYKSTTTFLVHDPNSSLRTGDVIAFAPLTKPRSQHVRHVVTAIRVPFGSDVSARPAIPTRKRVAAAARGKAFKKLKRRKTRAKAAAGDSVAKRRVRELGIGVQVIKSGTGRGTSRRYVLTRDVRAGKGGKAKVPQGRVR